MSAAYAERPHVPSSAQVVILGAGPAGIEAALAAQAHGYETVVLEAESVGASIEKWGHVRLFTPWELNVSPRGLSALEAAGRTLPDPAAFPTGEEFVASYLRPIADTALAGRLHCGVRAAGVSRGRQLKGEAIASPKRSNAKFRILWQSDPTGHEGILEADIVIDATGVYSNPNATGSGGIAAPGEGAVDASIVRQIPDVRTLLEQTRAESAGTPRFLIVGAGYSAATVLHDFGTLADRGDRFEVTWLLRNESGAPLREIEDDPLPQRRTLTDATNRLAASPPEWLTVERGATVEAFTAEGDTIQVEYSSNEDRKSCPVDCVISLTGFRPDPSLLRELQVHHCWATDGLMKLSAVLLGAEAGGDCLAQGSGGAETLINPEPNLFVIGNKSYGRLSTYLMRSGREQVEHIFSTLLANESGAAR